MNLSEKIRSLRKERGLTQEQFAEMLFVSRTAVSKWENGRGMPGMDSLQMIAKVFEISHDELLCAEEIIIAAETENKRNIDRFSFRMDAIFNVSSILSLFMPLYKTEAEGIYYSVALYQFDGRFAALYWALPLLMAACAIAEFLLLTGEGERWSKAFAKLGAALNIAAVFLLILGGQPYPAIAFFTLLLIKSAVMLIGRSK